MSFTPGGKSGLLHIGVKTEVNCDLPSNFLMACHALTVEIVIGLVQADFKDALFQINKRLLRGYLDIELSTSSQRDVDLPDIQSAMVRTWALSWNFLMSGKSTRKT